MMIGPTLAIYAPVASADLDFSFTRMGVDLPSAIWMSGAYKESADRSNNVYK